MVFKKRESKYSLWIYNKFMYFHVWDDYSDIEGRPTENQAFHNLFRDCIYATHMRGLYES